MPPPLPLPVVESGLKIRFDVDAKDLSKFGIKLKYFREENIEPILAKVQDIMLHNFKLMIQFIHNEEVDMYTGQSFGAIRMKKVPDPTEESGYRGYVGYFPQGVENSERNTSRPVMSYLPVLDRGLPPGVLGIQGNALKEISPQGRERLGMWALEHGITIPPQTITSRIKVKGKYKMKTHKLPTRSGYKSVGWVLARHIGSAGMRGRQLRMKIGQRLMQNWTLWLEDAIRSATLLVGAFNPQHVSGVFRPEATTIITHGGSASRRIPERRRARHGG